jgi:5S rRNA maturation endonuclease (ribonuclease M5)
LTPVDRVHQALETVGCHGRNGAWTCPAHEDTHPSLSVSEGVNGGAVLHCHTGCTPEQIVAALGLTMADLFTTRTNGTSREIVATYNYTDEHGTLLYQVVRYQPKDFRQRRPDGAGGWTWSTIGVDKVLYRLPAVRHAIELGDTIFIVEGEKDADRLTAAGYTATCNAGGAGKWRDEYTTQLEGAQHVVIIADNDQPGLDHAQHIHQALTTAGISDVRVVKPVAGKDTSDHFAAGHTVDQLILLPDVAGPEPSPDGPQPLDWHALFTAEHTGDDWLIENVIARGRGHALYAGHKAGKSLFMLWAIVEHLTTNPDTDVIYLDYEMTEDDIRERLEDMGHGVHTDLTRLHYYLLPSLPPLDTNEGRDAVLALVERWQRPGCNVLVVIDTTGRAVQGDENSADTIRAFYASTGIALKQRGVAWARLDHAGKDPFKGQRGSSAKGDDVDIVWHLVEDDDGISLHRDAARMSWVPEKVAYRMHASPLRYEEVIELWPAGTAHLAAELDRLDVPLKAGRPTARKILTDAGVTVRNDVIAAALRYRRERSTTL